MINGHNLYANNQRRHILIRSSFMRKKPSSCLLFKLLLMLKFLRSPRSMMLPNNPLLSMLPFLQETFILSLSPVDIIYIYWNSTILVFSFSIFYHVYYVFCHVDFVFLVCSISSFSSRQFCEFSWLVFLFVLNCRVYGSDWPL